MGILTWIVFGAIVGWLGFRLAGSSGQGCLTNIVIGVAGGMFGGSVLALVTGEDYLFAFGFPDVLINIAVSAVGAAVLVLGLRRLAAR
jgi:uncharacterized membrane protein YeaQ/YmgE (transglycosylase-associated protein family)